MGVASACVLMVSLLLVGVSVLFVMNVELLLSSVENKNEIVVFIKDDYPKEKISQAEESIKNLSNIGSAEFYSKEDALSDYIDQMKGYEEVFETLKEDNPLPDAFKVRIRDTSKITETVSQLSALEFTGEIKAPTDFAKILNKMKRVVSIISTALLIALISVSLIMISNSTRASVYARRREINIMKYVGATNAFIRTPFFFEGLFTGLISGIGASVVTYFGYSAIMDIITNDINFWQTIGISEPLPFSDVKYLFLVMYLCIGSIIGALGSVTSTTKHLQV